MKKNPDGDITQKSTPISEEKTQPTPSIGLTGTMVSIDFAVFITYRRKRSDKE